MEYLFSEEKLKFKNCKDLTKNLVVSAQTWVYNFFDSKYQLSVSEQNRIKDLFLEVTYEFVRDNKDGYINCLYDKKNKSIVIYNPNEEFFNKSILLAFRTIIHSLIHLVSKSEDKIKVIEEGYVSYVEKELFKYCLDNNYYIRGIYDEEKQVLTKEELKDLITFNSYSVNVLFTQCFQAICLSKRLDSVYEYFFNNYGFDRLKELANKVSLELGQIVDMQQFKECNSNNFIGLMEERILKKYLSNVSLEVITDTLLEDNDILLWSVKEKLSLEDRSIDLLKVAYRNLPSYVFDSYNVSYAKNIEEAKDLLIRDINAIDGMHVHKALEPLFNGISLQYTYYEEIPKKVSFWKKYVRQYERFFDIFDNFGLIHLEIICKVMQFDVIIENLVAKKDIEKRLQEFIKAVKLDDSEMVHLFRIKFYADLDDVRKAIINGMGINEIIKNIVMYELKSRLLFKVMISGMHKDDINDYVKVVCERYNRGVSDFCVHSYGMVMDAMIEIEEYLLKQQGDYLEVDFIDSFIGKVKQVFSHLDFNKEIIKSFNFENRIILCAIDLKNMGYDRLALLPEKMVLLLSYKEFSFSNNEQWKEVLMDVYYELYYEKINDTKRYYQFLSLLNDVMKKNVFINNLKNFDVVIDINGEKVTSTNSFILNIKQDIISFAKRMFTEVRKKFYEKMLSLNNVISFILEDGSFLALVIKSECSDLKIKEEVVKIEEEKGLSLKSAHFIDVLGLTNTDSADGIKNALGLYSNEYKDCLVLRKYIYCFLEGRINEDYQFYLKRETSASWLELSDILSKIILFCEGKEEELTNLMVKYYQFRKPYVYAMREPEKIGLLYAFEPLMYKLIAADKLKVKGASINDNLDLLKFICAIFEKGIVGVSKTQLNKLSKVIDELYDTFDITVGSGVLASQLSNMQSYLGKSKK